ncbi:hypothetical protein E2C01_081636 [Portunus trituberculatus]|uniref:Uncharacterized protein n=1 Tax=Portunus trituberculatus TaxID=210409 RepID=A0A5B7IMY1_PORTR|nr:hypothetical protein [Portunus trituberculatus]
MRSGAPRRNGDVKQKNKSKKLRLSYTMNSGNTTERRGRNVATPDMQASDLHVSANVLRV